MPPTAFLGDDSATRITVTKEQSRRLQKLLLEKPAGKRKFTDAEIRKNASRLKIPGVKIRHWLKQRDALDEGPERRVPVTVLETINNTRCKLLKTLSFEKKIFLLRKTATATSFSARLSKEISRELQIPESKIFNWLRHKVYRNARMKKSLSAEEAALLDKKLADYDYLDDDSALLLADRFNVNSDIIKKAFQRRRPGSHQTGKPVIEVKRFQIPASVSITPIPSTSKTAATSTPKSTAATPTAKRTKATGLPKNVRGRFNWKTLDQKNILFDAFRQSPNLIRPENLGELANATGLTSQQVSKWMSLFRVMWSRSNESGLKKLLTRGLNSSQLLALEKMYREVRFLNQAQLVELTSSTGAPRKTIQAWFTHRRIYEIRSGDKNLVNIAQKASAAKKDSNPVRMLKPTITIPQSSVAQLQPEQPKIGKLVEDPETNEFFESLTKEQKAYLKSCTKNFNVSYKRIAQAMDLPIAKVQHFIKSYRVCHSIFRKHKSSMPERVHKALLNHYVKYGKISSKMSVILAKRLKVRPEQIVSWNKMHTKRVLEVGGIVKPQPIAPAAAVEPAVVEEPVADAAEYYENAEEIATTSATIPLRSCGVSRKKKCNGKSSRYSVAAEAKMFLFEEFKKCPQTASTRSKQIAHVVKLTPMQVRKWLYNFGRKLSEQTKSKVVACLNNAEISAEARAGLEAEYKVRRFLEEIEMDELAARFGLSRRHISNWYINARYYEALTGECPGDKVDTGSSAASRSAPKLPRVVKFLYEELHPETQARLNDELNAYPFDDDRLNDLADELQISSDDLKKWFQSNTTRSGRMRRRSSAPATNVTPEDWYNLTTKQMQTLLSEFEADPSLTDERAASIAKRIKVTKERIKAWFEHRRVELHLDPLLEPEKPKPPKQTVPPIKIIMPKSSSSCFEMPTIAPSSKKGSKASKKIYECKVPNQLNMLFEEFKLSPNLTSERLLRISERTNLSGKQISSWFNWLNHRLVVLPRDTLSEENRSKYLTMQQIEVLENHYAEIRYVNRAAREALSIELGVPKAIIKSWFENRRNYELLCQNDDQPPYLPNETNYIAEEDQGANETVIDYDWEDMSTVVDESVEFEPKFDVKRPLEIDPLLDCSYPDEEFAEDVKMDVQSYNFQLLPDSPFIEDLTSLPYEPRSRFITPLDKDLEPIEEDIEKLFWFVNQTPNKINETYNQDIDDAKNRILESEFSKNPWPRLERISQLSADLLVSEPKLHWWFIKKRCFLTKTILTIPPPQPKAKPKSVLIDLTDDDGTVDDSVSESTKCGQFEFVTADETAQIKEEEPEEEPLIEGDILENSDPIDNNSIDDQPTKPCDNEKDSLRSEESLQPTEEATGDTNLASTSSVVKKKKKRIPLTTHQRAILTQEFKRNKVVPIAQVRLLAQDLGLSVGRIQAWFETMRKSSAQKKANLEATVSVKSLNPELESGLEAEYLKSVNLSDKRAKMIALKLNTKRKIVKKWFIERAKKNVEQSTAGDRDLNL